MQRLKVYYNKVIIPLLLKEFNYIKNSNIPVIEKIVINRGIDDSCQNSKVLDSLLQEISLISGQKSYLIRSKKSISSFKVKENMPVGISVTLRSFKMYSFLDRLINLVFPRIRDFQGLSVSSLDRFGNCSFSFNQQIMFPEVNFDKVIKLQGMDIVIVVKAGSYSESLFLLKSFGIPFKISLIFSFVFVVFYFYFFYGFNFLCFF